MSAHAGLRPRYRLLTQTAHGRTLASVPVPKWLKAPFGVEPKLLIIGVLIAMASPALGAVRRVGLEPHTGTAAQVSNRQLTALSVENVRLEAAAVTEAEPATALRFDLVNTTQQRLTEVVLEISIADKPSFEPGLATTRMLVRPFRIRGDVVLEPGYSVGFEVLLRRLSADCQCAANVRVVSVRFLLDEVASTSD